MQDWKQDHIELFKQLNEHEIRVKEQHDQIVAFPLTTVSALTGALYFLVEKTITVKVDCFTWFEWVFVSVSGLYYIVFLVSLFYLLRVFHQNKRRFKHFPMADEISKYQDDLIQYFKVWEGGHEVVRPKFVKEVNSFILETYIKTATHNYKVNDSVADIFRKAKDWLVGCAFLFVIVSILSIVKMLFL